MNPNKTKWETISYISKYMTIGIILYVVVPYAWKVWKKEPKAEPLLG